MFHFIVRRTLYSILILLGVVTLTFVLFNVASGDPAAAVLGKNARPEEVDSLRRELGADLPLFYGKLCATEAYPACRKGEPLRPGVEVAGSELRFHEQFAGETTLVMRIVRNGKITEKEVAAAPVVAVEAAGLDRVEFFRIQKSPWNSQFLRAVKEIVSVRPAAELEIADPHRYRVRTLPAVGALLRDEDAAEQMTLL